MAKKNQNKKFEKKPESQELSSKKWAEMIYQMGLEAVKNPNFLKNLKNNPELAKSLLNVNKNLEESKKYHELGEKELGIKKEDITNSNIKIQKILKNVVNPSTFEEKENIESQVDITGSNEFVEDN
jgi:hypothetical protein